VLLFLTLVIGLSPAVLLVGIIGVLRFGNFWEFLVAGFFFELLYGVGGWATPIPLPLFLGSAILFVGTKILREKLR